ncbi:hypothetical protein ACWEQU_29450 [Streptomyces nodosus]
MASGLTLGAVGLDLLPEALRVAGDEVFGVTAALLLFVAGGPRPEHSGHRQRPDDAG